MTKKLHFDSPVSPAQLHSLPSKHDQVTIAGSELHQHRRVLVQRIRTVFSHQRNLMPLSRSCSPAASNEFSRPAAAHCEEMRVGRVRGGEIRTSSDERHCTAR